MTVQESITKLVDRQDLSRSEAYDAMDAIMSGNATENLISAFLIALRMKGETAEEIAGCAEAMRSKSQRILARRQPVIDTCGTGGDGSGTFNISTAAAIVAASAGANVAKHGNRSVSSKCGSADVLASLGVNIDLPPDRVAAVLDEVGITFLFAPKLHQAMKFAVGVRKDLGLRTIFNILGPLTNPANAKRQVLGVFNADLTDTMARVLLQLGSEHAVVMHGAGGLDEFSTVGPTRVSELRNGSVRTYSIGLDEIGLQRASVNDLQGGDASRNASIVKEILNGKKGPGRDIVVFNAGAALYVAGKSDTIKDGMNAAAEAIDSGSARAKLEQWKEATNRPV